MKAFVIIGAPRTRKSSTIRALTGAFGRQAASWSMAYSSSTRSTYVQISALQESGLTAAAFMRAVANSGDERVIVALRANAMTRQGIRYHDASHYLAAFKAANWTVETATLGTYPGLVGLSRNNHVELTPTSRPANAIASRLRAVWKIQ